MDYNRLHQLVAEFGKKLVAEVKGLQPNAWPCVTIMMHPASHGDGSGVSVKYSLRANGKGDNIDDAAHPGEMLDEWKRRSGWANRQEQKVLANIEVLKLEDRPAVRKTPDDQPF